MSSELEYDLRDVLAYIRARVLESQQAYESLAAGSTHTHDSIDSGSLRSQSTASFCSSHSAQSHNNSPCAYREIIAGSRAEISPDRYQQHRRDEEAIHSEPSSQDSRFSSIRSEDTPAFGTTTPSESQHKSSYESNPRPEKIRTTVQHKEPHSRSIPTIKAVRFEEHDVGALPMTTDLSKVEEQPRGKTSGPAISLERSRSVSSLRRTLSLRRTRSVGYVSASPANSAPPSRPSRIDSVLQTDRTDTVPKTDSPTYHPLTTVPVKKGWVRRMARAFTEKGEENRY
jgi:hypothetical protein